MTRRGSGLRPCHIVPVPLPEVRCATDFGSDHDWPIAVAAFFRLARGMAAQDLLRQYYDMLMESQYWPPEQLLAFQRQQLAQLLRHARAQVPFYERRLDAVVRPNGDIDWDRWGEIPILKRSDLLEYRDAMLARELPPGHGPTHDFSTSGSTGAPVTVRSTTISSLVGRASVWRMHRWHEADWSRPMLSWMGESRQSASPDGQEVGRWGPDWDSGTGKLLYVSRTWPPEQVLKFAARNGVAYLTGRPKSMQYLALDALLRAENLSLHGLLCFGTAVTEDERADCRAAFGAEIWSHYSSKEMGPIAHQCPSCAHLHVNAESILVEVVDDDGRAVSPGALGRVVSTSLYSTAQPLVRYEQGDLAVAGEACSCGRTLPVLQRVAGRVTNLFRFPDGAKVAPSIPDHYRSLLGAQYWQIAQVAPLELEVRYVPFDNRGADQAAFAEVVRRHIHRDDVRIRFATRDTLERAAGGKFAQYVCELPK